MAKKKAAAPATDTLLVELLTEELPPKALKSLSETFAQTLAVDLGQGNFLAEGSETRVFGTPRLAAIVTKVLAQAPDKQMEFGSSVKVALDSEGMPTVSAARLRKKQGVTEQTRTPGHARERCSSIELSPRAAI
jgi:glycyl-tRNA synthetase beta chain